jgi:3-methyladenine DNA glycosylase AlkD
MVEEMIVTGAWWDVVDPLATHRLRELLDRFPRPMTRTMLRWSRDHDLWKRRAAILCQVRRQQATDLDLLFACIEANLLDAGAPAKDFFIRKAIGWALRDYAWVDLPTVERWVEAHADRLAPLSRREALKNAAALSSAHAEKPSRRRPAPRS